MVDAHPFWRGRQVFVTGHSGFKGSWLTLWLLARGATVSGFSLPDSHDPAPFFARLPEAHRLRQASGDVADLAAVREAMARACPSVVFHLAAQSLVLPSYQDPLATYRTNVMGTANVLEAARGCPSVKAVVVVTSDKCYENREWLWPYRETEPLGGRDPYSNSKACAELVTAAYRDSFLAKSGVQVATVRAGNVIGGGDWAEHRLVPDFFRALRDGSTLQLRSPGAVRPWQHVLEPLHAYLLLAQRLVTDGAAFATSWNCGPADASAVTVRRVVEGLCRIVPAVQVSYGEEEADAHEARYLRIDSSRARALLGWQPRWQLDVALARTAEWYLASRAGQDTTALSLAQIGAFAAAGEA